MTQIEQVRKELNKWNDRSAWNKGVAEYALELRDNADYALQSGRQLNNLSEWKEVMLNGATDWKEYSYGGFALIYNEDIAKKTLHAVRA